LTIFEALRPWTGDSGASLLHSGRGKKGLLLMDLSRALWLLDLHRGT
jgi:hypothetical protein